MKRSRVRLDVDERRAQLVELGLAEFGTRSFDEVSIDLLAERARISKGLLYHYFPNKRAFYVACLEEAAGRLVARLDAVSTEGSPLDHLVRAVDAYLAHVRGHGRAFATLMRGGIGQGREIAEVVDRTREALVERLTQRLAEVIPAVAIDLAPPLLQVALRGWIGFAEAASIAWVEATIAAENDPARAVPETAAVRDVIVRALVATVQQAAG